MSSNTLWNKLILPPPEVPVYGMWCEEPKEVVPRLSSLFNEIRKNIFELDSFNMESLVLSKIIYRIKRRLRGDKGVQAMLKVKRCIAKYLQMNFLDELSLITKTLSINHGPSLQLLQWFLVRLQGLAQLFHQIYLMCVESGQHLIMRINTGHLWPMVLISLACISRIWVIAQHMVLCVCDFYEDLHGYLDTLKPAPEQWLPPEYKLPSNLAKFLCEPSYVMKKRPRFTDSAIFHNLKQYMSENKEGFVTSLVDDSFRTSTLSEELGECISREELNIIENIKNSSIKRKSQEIEYSLQEEYKTKKLKLIKNEEEKVTNISKMSKNKIVAKKKMECVSNNKEMINTFGTSKNKVQQSINQNEEKLEISNDYIKNKSTDVNKGRSNKNKDIIDNIMCYNDLKKFFEIEQKNRSANNSLKVDYLTKNMDKLQFQMFSNFITRYLKKMKNVRDEEKLQTLMKKLRIKLRVFVSN